MGRLLQTLFPTKQPERRAINDDLLSFLGINATTVTPNTALQLATVYACVRVLAESVAMLPLILYERTASTRNPATDHPLFPILHSLWNPEITSVEARMALMYWLALYGNGYAQIVRDRGGRIAELWPLAADRMTLERTSKNAPLRYLYQEDGGKPKPFSASEILHVRGLSTNGVMGLSPIATARNAFSKSQARSQYDEAFYLNGARPGGVLQHPGKLTDNAYNRLLKSWEDRHKGADAAGKVAILEEGMQYASMAIPQTDQQFLESQKYDANQIAAIFHVPAHMINDLERATFANIAEKGQEFVDYTLAPWFTVWEQAIARDLLSVSERTRYYAKHKAQALLRGNPTERGAYYTTGLQNGFLSINDVRDLEDMNPVDGGDTHFVQLNMAPLDMAVTGVTMSAQTEPPAQEQARSHEPGCTCGQHERRTAQRADGDVTEDLRLSRVEMARAMYPVLEDAARRLTRREVRDVKRQVDKLLAAGSVAAFRDWLEKFYRDEWAPVVVDVLKAPMSSYARQAMLAAAAELGEKPKGLTDDLRAFVGSYLDSTGNGWAASSRGQLEALLDGAIEAGQDPVTPVTERLDGWETTKPGKTADKHSFEALNAFTIASYGAYGVTQIRWVASGESCPYCRALDGKVIAIDGFVVAAGGSVDAGDGSPPLTVSGAKRHAPLHGGCDCVTIAVRV